MKAIIEKSIEIKRNPHIWRAGCNTNDYIGMESRTTIIRIFSIPILKKVELFSD